MSHKNVRVATCPQKFLTFRLYTEVSWCFTIWNSKMICIVPNYFFFQIRWFIDFDVLFHCLRWEQLLVSALKKSWSKNYGNTDTANEVTAFLQGLGWDLSQNFSEAFEQPGKQLQTATVLRLFQHIPLNLKLIAKNSLETIYYWNHV